MISIGIGIEYRPLQLWQEHILLLYKFLLLKEDPKL
jgi:hypothetical protein